MPNRYITSEGDALDLICLRHYGVQAGAVERVLEANPHIAAMAERLPRGAEITLPEIAVQRTAASPRLWD